MLPQTSDAKPKLSAESITYTNRALTHVNTDNPPLRSARNEINSLMVQRASPEFHVDVNCINLILTHA